MKELKNNWTRAIMALLVITATFNTSCNKNNNEVVQKADYVGVWNSDAVASSLQAGDYKDVLTLTSNSFNDAFQIYTSGGTWVNSFALKGSMTVNANMMNVHVSEIGSAIDPVSGEFTGTMTTYKENSPIFGLIISYSGQKQDFQAEYTVNGNKLTLKKDMNGDGDYNDQNESTVYTRQ